MSFLTKVKTIHSIWTDHKYELFVVTCIILLIGFGIYNWCKGEDGSWSSGSWWDFSPAPALLPVSPEFRSPNKRVRESKGELECRRVLQKYFNRPFNKKRPNFLNNPVTGGKVNLEIDCFNEELKIGCEYDGEPHFKYIPYFHKNKEAFDNVKYRDYMKNIMCEQNGITLIRVPYTVKHPDIESFIINKLKRAGF